MASVRSWVERLRGGDRVVRHDDFDRGRAVVVLLHGRFQNRNLFEVMEDRLRFDGYAVMSFRVPRTGSSRSTAAWLDAKLARQEAQWQLDGVHLVGHHTGGLVARAFAERAPGRVKGVVTLAAPHHRGGLGTLASSVPARRRDGRPLPWTRWVGSLGRDEASVPLTSIYSTDDMVCPWWRSELRPHPGPTQVANVRVTKVGHSALTWDPGVYRIVRDRIEQAEIRHRRDNRADPLAAR